MVQSSNDARLPAVRSLRDDLNGQSRASRSTCAVVYPVRKCDVDSGKNFHLPKLPNPLSTALIISSILILTMIRRALASRGHQGMALRHLKRLSESQGKRVLSSASADGARMSILYPLLGGILLTTAGATKYVHDNVGGTEGLVRSLSFYRYE